MLALLIMSLFFQQTERPIVRMEEEVKFLYPGKLEEVVQREIWIGQGSIRIDTLRNEEDMTMIFIPGRRQMYVINHTDRTYYFVLTARDRRVLRPPLQGLGRMSEGTFEKPSILAIPTRQRNKIGQWNCKEYQVNYPDNFGVVTNIWTTNTPTPLDRSGIRLFFHAALGTSTVPYDVKNVINQLLRDIRGTPIRVVTTVSHEGLEVTTVRTVRKIEYKRVGPGFFDLPRGYNILDKGTQ